LRVQKKKNTFPGIVNDNVSLDFEDSLCGPFVAMPKGSSFSIEIQMTGQDLIGDFQFEVVLNRNIVLN